MKLSAKLGGVVLALLGAVTAQQMSHGPGVEMKDAKAQKKHEVVLSGFMTPINGKLKMRATEVEIAPGGYIGDHLHYGPGIRQMISGEMTLVNADTGQERVVRAGDYFEETGDVSIRPYNRSSAPARFAIFELVPADLETSASVPLSRRPDLEKEGPQLKEAICGTSK